MTARSALRYPCRRRPGDRLLHAAGWAGGSKNGASSSTCSEPTPWAMDLAAPSRGSKRSQPRPADTSRLPHPHHALPANAAARIPAR